MESTTVRSRVPIPIVLLIVVALVVVGLLLAQAAVAIFVGIVRLALILGAFAAIGLIGVFLWRRGDIGGAGN